VPVQLRGISNAVAIAAGAMHAMALLADNSIAAWGYNYYGQLGDGVVYYRATPINMLLEPSVSSCVCADYDGDAKADPATYDEATGTWNVKISSANYSLITTTLNGLGSMGLGSMTADYDGDAKADPAVYQETSPSTGSGQAGTWIILPSSLNYAVAIAPTQPFGGAGYSGMPADYDGDRLADPAVYYRGWGDWRVLLSSANYYPLDLPNLLGGYGYRAVAADYDGDRLADPAVYGETTGLWTIMLSRAGYAQITLSQSLGGSDYIPVPADYDGDGLADPAVRNGTSNEWIVMLSTANYTPVHLTLSFK
jgi:hypothetical protein